MKVRLYLDVWPHDHAGSQFFATSHPGVKTDTVKRYAVDVTVPSPRDADVDAHLPPDSVKLVTDEGLKEVE